MTEKEWLTCTDSDKMLEFLQGKTSDRKLRLLACAFCRMIWPYLTDSRCRRVVEAAERYADAEVDRSTLAEAAQALRAKERGRLRTEKMEAARLAGRSDESATAKAVAWAAGWDATKATSRAEAWDAARLTYQAVSVAHSQGRASFTSPVDQTVIFGEIFGNPFRPTAIDSRWITSTVIDLARTIYDERTHDRMPVLADALMDAGCDNEEIISHCRSDGPHVRGCWVIDLLLSKS